MANYLTKKEKLHIASLCADALLKTHRDSLYASSVLLFEQYMEQQYPMPNVRSPELKEALYETINAHRNALMVLSVAANIPASAELTPSWRIITILFEHPTLVPAPLCFGYVSGRRESTHPGLSSKDKIRLVAPVAQEPLAGLLIRQDQLQYQYVNLWTTSIITFTELFEKATTVEKLRKEFPESCLHCEDFLEQVVLRNTTSREQRQPKTKQSSEKKSTVQDVYNKNVEKLEKDIRGLEKKICP